MPSSAFPAFSPPKMLKDNPPNNASNPPHPSTPFDTHPSARNQPKDKKTRFPALGERKRDKFPPIELFGSMGEVDLAKKKKGPPLKEGRKSRSFPFLSFPRVVGGGKERKSVRNWRKIGPAFLRNRRGRLSETEKAPHSLSFPLKKRGGGKRSPENDGEIVIGQSSPVLHRSFER